MQLERPWREISRIWAPGMLCAPKAEFRPAWQVRLLSLGFEMLRLWPGLVIGSLYLLPLDGR